MIGDGLRVIAGGLRRDAALSLLVGQRQQLVQRAALLERGGELQILEFEKDLAARELRQRRRMAHRRALDRAGDALRRGADVVEVGKGATGFG